MGILDYIDESEYAAWQRAKKRNRQQQQQLAGQRYAQPEPTPWQQAFQPVQEEPMVPPAQGPEYYAAPELPAAPPPLSRPQPMQLAALRPPQGPVASSAGMAISHEPQQQTPGDALGQLGQGALQKMEDFQEFIDRPWLRGLLTAGDVVNPLAQRGQLARSTYLMDRDAQRQYDIEREKAMAAGFTGLLPEGPIRGAAGLTGQALKERLLKDYPGKEPVEPETFAEAWQRWSHEKENPVVEMAGSLSNPLGWLGPVEGLQAGRVAVQGAKALAPSLKAVPKLAREVGPAAKGVAKGIGEGLTPVVQDMRLRPEAGAIGDLEETSPIFQRANAIAERLSSDPDEPASIYKRISELEQELGGLGESTGIVKPTSGPMRTWGEDKLEAFATRTERNPYQADWWDKVDTVDIREFNESWVPSGGRTARAQVVQQELAALRREEKALKAEYKTLSEAIMGERPAAEVLREKGLPVPGEEAVAAGLETERAPTKQAGMFQAGEARPQMKGAIAGETMQPEDLLGAPQFEDEAARVKWEREQQAARGQTEMFGEGTAVAPQSAEVVRSEMVEGVRYDLLKGKTDWRVRAVDEDSGQVVGNIRIYDDPQKAEMGWADVLGKAQRMTREPAPESLPPMQDNYSKPLSTYASRMYRETSIDDVIPFIDKYTSMDMNLDQVHMSNTPDLALGQGRNKGVIIELDTNKIQGHVNTKKPGWEFTYQNGQAEFIAKYNSQQQYIDAVRSITIKPDAKGGKGWNIRLKKVIADWPRTVNADGSVTYTKPSVVEDTPNLASGDAEARSEGAVMGEPVAPQATKQPWEMTLAELNRTGYIAYDTATNQPFVKASASINEAANTSEHERVVAKALSEGKPVPHEVISEYPDLAAQYKGAGKTAITEPAPVTPAEAALAATGQGAVPIETPLATAPETPALAEVAPTPKPAVDPLQAEYAKVLAANPRIGQYMRYLNQTYAKTNSPIRGLARYIDDAGNVFVARNSKEGKLNYYRVDKTGKAVPVSKAGAEWREVSRSGEMPTAGQRSEGDLTKKPASAGANVPPPKPPIETGGPTGEMPLAGQEPNVLTKNAQESLERSKGTPEQAAELRADEKGRIGNINPEKFPEWVRDDIRPAVDESNQYAGARRGVISDKQAREMAIEAATGRTYQDWLKTKPGRVYNEEETLALGNTVSRVMREHDELKQAVKAAEATGKVTDEMRYQLVEKQLLMKTLLGVFSGQAAEHGRGLRAHRFVLTGEFASRAEAYRTAVKKLGDTQAYNDWAAAYELLDPNDYIGKAKLFQKLNEPTWTHKVLAYTVSNMLSGTKTQEVNFFSDLLRNLERPVETALEGHPRAAADDLIAQGRAIGKAWGDAGTAFWTGIRPSDAMRIVEEGKFEARIEAFPGKKGVLITPALRAMAWGDEFHRVLATAGALANAARRETGRTGRTVDDLLKNPTDSMLKYAANAADEAVYEGKSSPFVHALANLRNKVHEPGAANKAIGITFYVLTPFLRIPEVIFVKGTQMLAKPITGPVHIAASLAKGDVAQARKHLGETMLATGLLTAVYSQVMAGNITGNGPENADRRKMLMEARDEKGNPIWQPHSIRVGDRWVDYINLGHYAVPLLAISSAVEAYEENQKKPDTKMATEVFDKTMKGMMDATYIKSMADIFKSISQGNLSGALNVTAGNTLGRFVPLSSLLAQVTRAQEQEAKAPTNPVEMVAARIPGLSEQIPERLTSFGEPIQQPVDLLAQVSPFKTSAPGEPNRAAAELARLKMSVSTVPDKLGETDLTRAQQRLYQEQAGQAAKSGLETVIGSTLYQQAPSDKIKAAILRRVADKARELARESVAEKKADGTYRVYEQPQVSVAKLQTEIREYVQALHENAQLLAIPKYRSVPPEKEKVVTSIESRVSAIKAAESRYSPAGAENQARKEGRFSDEDWKWYMRAKGNLNPARTKFVHEHPIYRKWFRGAAEEYLQLRTAS